MGRAGLAGTRTRAGAGAASAPPRDREPLDEPAASGPLNGLVRKFAALGLSGFFSTESAIRKAFGDTVPQDWVDFVTEQSDRGRQELFDRIAAEMGRVLDRMDVEEVLERLVAGRTIEIEARVRIGPRSDDESEDAEDTGTRFDVRTRD